MWIEAERLLLAVSKASTKPGASVKGAVQVDRKKRSVITDQNRSDMQVAILRWLVSFSCCRCVALRWNGSSRH